MSQRKKVQTIKAWGGFSDDKLYFTYPFQYDERRYAIFKTRREARMAFEDVRPVKILVEVKHAK